MKSYSWPLTNQQFQELLEVDLITFDLFDTLVCRTANPRDHYKIYGRLGKLLRHFLELSWRFFQKFGLVKDFELRSLILIFGKRINKEFETDLNQLIPRKQVIELLYILNNRNKRIEIVTNTYYTKQQVRIICRKFGIPDSVNLIVSSEVGLSKKDGLFQKSNSRPFTSHWHLGDDFKEDSNVSEDTFVFVPKIWEQISVFQSKLYASPKEWKCDINLRHALTSVAVQYEDESNPWFWFGLLYSGPLAIAIAQKLEKIANQIGGEYIYCLARDGYFPFSYLQLASKLKIRYLPYSRKISHVKANLKKLNAWIQEDCAENRSVVFDLGWRGNSASKLCNEIGKNANLVLFGRWPWHKQTEDLHLLFGPKRTLWKALNIRRCPELVELALSAPHSSLEVLPSNLNDWLNQINFNTSGAAYHISRGVFALQSIWWNGGNREISLDISSKSLSLFMRNPSYEFLILAARETHEYKNVSVPLINGGDGLITFWIRGSWLYQKYLGFSLKTRIKIALKELIRRVMFEQ